MSEGIRIGMAGTGAIGLPIAHRVLRAEGSLTVYNRTAGKAAVLHDAGAEVAVSPCALADSSDAIITCLFGPQSVHDVYLGSQGLFEADVTGKLFLNVSTVGSACALEIEAESIKRGAQYVDGAILGNPRDVEAGRLLVMLAGTTAGLDLGRRVAATFAETAHEVGPVGAAQALKLGHNLHFAIRAVALAEIARYYKASGADPEVAIALFRERSAALGTTLDASMESMLMDRPAAPGDLGTLAKDVGLALASGGSLDCALSLGSSANEALHEAVASGLADRHVSSLLSVVS